MQKAFCYVGQFFSKNSFLVVFSHFRRYLDIWTVFVPQILFISSIFGYLVFVIIYKWVAWNAQESMVTVFFTIIYSPHSMNIFQPWIKSL